MPETTRATLLVLGSVGGIYSLGYALDFRGWTSRMLTWIYRRWGNLLWPFRSQRMYVRFNLIMGWFLVIGCAYFLIAGVTGWGIQQ